ncbi:(E3-independent) E2 ubiquitin-conjugating enzyme UBE2O isoform X2 [Oratosquilla oratoria]|uniref:(E3-independent) E2 ubiquitin-conjugating enzyme UBE2O isoform X2 n=1 Tax=Oratosquilla oratoria TaxID=337810 RepID=UPI003F76F201
MAQEYQYFYEDEVYIFNKKGHLELGMVLENAEFVSSDEDSDIEEEEKVKKGYIRVAWYPKGEEQVLAERKVGLADRSLMPGDVVRRLIRGKDTQRGYCRQVHVTASVQVVGTKHVILNVNSNDLTPLEEFTTDIAVALDSWVGMVSMVKCRLIVVCQDGSRCIMSDQEALDLDELRDTRDRDSEFRRYDFYPGQQLIGPSRAFEKAEWIHKTVEMASHLLKPHKSVKVTVEEVQVVQLGVRWQCRAFSNDPNADKEQPKYLVQEEDLKRVRMLNVFEPCTLQLGDRNYYTLKETDVILTRDNWRKLKTSQLMEDTTNPCPLRPRPSKNKSKLKGACRSRSQLKQSSIEKDGASACADADENGDKDGDTEDGKDCMDVNDSDGFIDVDTDDCSDTASISSGASTGSQGRRNRKGPALMTKMLKKRKLKRAKRKSISEPKPIKPGDQLVVETLMTSSRADVVWQDGTLENNISSTVLYPIHHLDDQEFFPGDFVVEQHESNPHEYGVVQKVDHGGRTSIVKWFQTYTAGSEPQPHFLSEQEVSVYDLRDHPDFRYRPGSVVIRVANFENGQTCSTGQVLDNYPSGEVLVWWVSGETSVCYPQDLYKVGEYDSDDGELWDDSSSETSWETESIHSTIAEDSEGEGDGLLKIRLVANIEKARIAMSRLEEIFTQNPALQTTAVMKQLLDCYKECRYMDKLMGTSFFHESNFQGLIEKVRERGRASTAQRVTEQINRLFSSSSEPEQMQMCRLSSTSDVDGLCNNFLVIGGANSGGEGENGNPEIVNKAPTTKDGTKMNNMLNPKDAILHSSSTLSENLANLSFNSTITPTNSSFNSSVKQSRNEKPECVRSKGSESLKHKRMSESDMTLHDKTTIDPTRMKDSKSCNDLKDSSSNVVSEEIKTSHMCAQLCSLMKAQLLKTYEEVVLRYGGHFDMSLMQACQDNEGILVENKENIPVCVCDDKINQNTPASEESKGAWEDQGASALPISKETNVPNAAASVPNEVLTSPVEGPASNAKNTTINSEPDGFLVLEAAPDSHKFKLTMFQPTDPPNFYRTVKKEMKLLSSSLPSGIWVRGYEDRMDLYSVMIRGPERTPYEDGLFFFDFQLSADYPRAPPLCHYITYCSDKLNPNLYEDGKVCVSLLGTWSGKGTEIWTSQSNLLQVIISIQGLILVNEPYFNEAGYERQKGTQQGRENSRMYNEMVVLKLIQSMSKLIKLPPEIFKEEIIHHFHKKAYRLVRRLEKWLEISEIYNKSHPLSPTTPTTFREINSGNEENLPEFPLIPASKGFCLTLHKTLHHFKEVLGMVGVSAEGSSKGAEGGGKSEGGTVRGGTVTGGASTLTTNQEVSEPKIL